MPMSPKSKSKKSSKKGGVMELSPLAAAGVLYATGMYAKKASRKMRGGEDVVSTNPGGAVPVVSAGKLEVPNQMMAGSLNMTGNKYVGATASSRAAPVDAPVGLLQEGGAKKRGRKGKKRGGDDGLSPVPSMGGTCGHMAYPVPPGTLSGGNLGLSPVVTGAVGGVAAQSMPGELVGGAKRRGRKGKGKKRGGADGAMEEGGSMSPEEAVASYEGGGKKRGRKGKKRGGAEVEAFDKGGSEAPALGGFNSLLDDLKKQVGGAKHKGGAFKLYAKELAALSKKLKKLA